MAQIHKRFTDLQVKELIERYLKKEIERTYIQELLCIKRRRFCNLVAQYRKNPKRFTIQYNRKTPSRISRNTENKLIKELSFEKNLIMNKSVPLRSYNYSYIKDLLDNEISLPTIINRAKKHGFYLKKPKRKAHDREVLTNYAGELIQHDSSHHKWSPYAQDKWYLIDSLDDHSRLILFAKLFKKETSWAHISAMESVFLKYGLPY